MSRSRIPNWCPEVSSFYTEQEQECADAMARLSERLANPKAWYQKWLNDEHNQANRPPMGFLCERGWACVFTKPGRLCSS